MGITKIGLSLIERCAKYTNFCGKKSILQTVPQNLSKINLKGIKYAPKLKSDIVQLNKFVKPSEERISEILNKNGLEELSIKNADGTVKGLGDIDEGYSFISDNNSIFLEKLSEMFPIKVGKKANTKLQKIMLYLQDINHKGFTDKNKFLEKVLGDIKEIENIKALDGNLLYGEDTISLYSKKAILQAKYNNPERYKDIMDMIKLHQKGIIPMHNVQIFFPESKIHRLIKSDLTKLLNGESYYPKLSSLSEKEISKIEFGEVFSVGKKMYVKTESGYKALKMDSQTYEKLFPAIERYSISQNQVGNCGKIASWNALIKNPKSRVMLYDMIEQTPQGIRINMQKLGYSHVFDYKNLEMLNTPENLQGSLGHKMFEYTYDMNHLGKLDTVCNPRPILIKNITGVEETSKNEIPYFDFIGNPQKLAEYVKDKTNGIFIRNGGDCNLNIGSTDGHYYSTTDLSTGIWQNPWTGVEELPLGQDSTISGCSHLFK